MPSGKGKFETVFRLPPNLRSLRFAMFSRQQKVLSPLNWVNFVLGSRHLVLVFLILIYSAHRLVGQAHIFVFSLELVPWIRWDLGIFRSRSSRSYTGLTLSARPMLISCTSPMLGRHRARSMLGRSSARSMLRHHSARSMLCGYTA